MARHEDRFLPAEEAALSTDELLAVAARLTGAKPSRSDALACFLSSGEGWTEALRSLGGAFADSAGESEDQKK